MPVVCISPNDNFVYIETGQLACKYDEKVIDYFNHSIHSLGKTRDKRLTIVGHGNRTLFGEDKLTAKMLAADLIAANLSTTVEIIDLVGCGIGEADDTKSFIAEFTEELTKVEKYKNIQVNGFCNLISDEPIQEDCEFRNILCKYQSTL